jgi:hypothetical protein
MPFDPNDFGLPNDYEPDFTDPVPFSPRKFMDYLRDFGTALTSGLATKVGVTEKGAVNGVATLGPDGRLPQTQLPITGTTTVDWGAVYNRPAAFPPSAHTHTRAHITDLQPALDAKANVSHAHLIADVAGLQTILDGKAAVADVSAVQTAAMPRAGGVFTGGTQWRRRSGSRNGHQSGLHSISSTERRAGWLHRVAGRIQPPRSLQRKRLDVRLQRRADRGRCARGDADVGRKPEAEPRRG